MGQCCGKKKANPSSGRSGSEFGARGRSGFESSGESKEERRQRLQKLNMSSLVHTVIDKDDFDAKLKEAGSNLVVVDFYATWCGPCKMISPKLEEMAKQMTDVCFLKVDVDECEEIATLYGISCMPTFIFFKNGEKVKEFSGANEEKIREIITSSKLEA